MDKNHGLSEHAGLAQAGDGAVRRGKNRACDHLAGHQLDSFETVLPGAPQNHLHENVSAGVPPDGENRQKRGLYHHRRGGLRPDGV